MAPRVGQVLHDARTQRGIALNDVERVTGIRVQHLRALEEERWERIPEGETRGLLSAYAHYLGLDEGALLGDYERSARRGKPKEEIPGSVLRPVGISREHHRRRIGLLGAAGLAVILLGVVLVAALGSSGDGDDEDGGRAPAADEQRTAETTTATTEPTTAPTEASVELSATADVWVCLVGADGSQPVNGETLAAGDARGPFTGSRFEMTFGNGSVELTVNGDPVKVPALAEPLGFRVTPAGARRLAPGSEPTCA